MLNVTGWLSEVEATNLCLKGKIFITVGERSVAYGGKQ
jgi:hypothetical protein